MNTISLNQSKRSVVTLIILAFIGLVLGIFAYGQAAMQSEDATLPWMSFGHFGLITFFALLAYAKPRARATPVLCFLVLLMLAIMMSNK